MITTHHGTGVTLSRPGSPDSALGLWAGELPLVSLWQQPVPDPALPAGTVAPAHIQDLSGRAAYRPERR